MNRVQTKCTQCKKYKQVNGKYHKYKLVSGKVQSKIYTMSKIQIVRIIDIYEKWRITMYVQYLSLSLILV